MFEHINNVFKKIFNNEETIIFSSNLTPGNETGSEPVLIIILSELRSDELEHKEKKRTINKIENLLFIIFKNFTDKYFIVFA